MVETMIQVTSLAALRRAIVPGARIHVLSHWQDRLVGTWRTPNRIQGNGFSWSGVDKDGKACEMWCYHPPKRAEIRFNEDGSVTYFPAHERSWTLAFYPPQQGATNADAI